MPSGWITCWSTDVCSAAIELPMSYTSETRCSTTLCYLARLLSPSPLSSLLHSWNETRHESRKPIGTRVVVPQSAYSAPLSSSTSHRHEQLFLASSLSRLCMRCYMYLRTPGLAPAAQARANNHQPLPRTVPATSIHKYSPVPGGARAQEGRTLVLRIIVPLPTSHIRPAQTPIVASSNFLNVCDTLESC